MSRKQRTLMTMFMMVLMCLVLLNAPTSYAETAEGVYSAPDEGVTAEQSDAQAEAGDGNVLSEEAAGQEEKNPGQEEISAEQDDNSAAQEDSGAIQENDSAAQETLPDEGAEALSVLAVPAVQTPAKTTAPAENDARHGVKGWNKTSAGERYYYADGKFYKNTIVTISGKKYAFDGNGYLKHWLFSFDGHTYYANAKGELVTSRMKTIKGNLYYFNKYGAANMGRFTGPNGKQYYAARDGVIHRGLFTEGGHTYYANGRGELVTSQMKTIKGNLYYFNKYGAANMGRFRGPNGKQYYAARNGVIHKWRFTEGGRTYYANGRGELTTSRFKTIKGDLYYFDKSGAAATGRFTGPGGKQYYADHTGKIHKYLFTESGDTYYANGDGVLAIDQLVTMHRTGETMFFDMAGKKGLLVRGKSRTSTSTAMEISSPQGRQAELQMYVGGKWVKKGVVQLPEGAGTERVEIAFPDQWWPYEASEWRLKIPAGNGAGAYTSKTICISADRFYQNPKGMVQISNVISKHGLSYYASPVQTNNASSRKDHVEAMIDRAYDYRGDPFVVCQSRQPGRGVDCSGLVMQACYASGVDLWPSNPYRHLSREYEYESRNIYKMNSLEKVKWADRQRGDLIFYSKNGTVIHVAIYLGNNKVIHAYPGNVRVSSVYGWGDIEGVRRVFH